MRKIFYLGVAVLALGASPAWAGIELKCYEGPEAVAQLKAEMKAADQQPVIIGNRTGGNWNVNMFTSDFEGKIGYNIEGNERFGSGKQSTTLCVTTKYRSIVINDVTQPGIPKWALVGSDPKIAGPAAKAAGYGAGVHDDSVRTGERNGSRVAMGAIARVTGDDGIERDGPLVLIGYNPSLPRRNGSMSVTDHRGVRQILVSMVDTEEGVRMVELYNRSKRP